MARKVTLKDGNKALADCTIADIEEMAAGAKKPASILNDNVDDESALYARLLQEMRLAGAETVADLGKAKLDGWESLLGLKFASWEQIGKGTRADPAAGEEKTDSEGTSQ